MRRLISYWADDVKDDEAHLSSLLSLGDLFFDEFADLAISSLQGNVHNRLVTFEVHEFAGNTCGAFFTPRDTRGKYKTEYHSLLKFAWRSDHPLVAAIKQDFVAALEGGADKCLYDPTDIHSPFHLVFAQ